MRRSGPVLLAVGALLMAVGGVGHYGIVWAVGVVLAAGGLGALVAPRSRPAGVALAVVLIAGLAVYPWLAQRSATAGQARWSVHARDFSNFGLTATGGRVLELDGTDVRLLDARTGRPLRETRVAGDRASQALDGSFFVVGDDDALTAYDRDGRRRWSRARSFIGPIAAAEGTTLVGGCAGKRCGVRAVDAHGRVRWTRRATGRYIELSRQLPPRANASPRLLPDLALVSGPDGKESNTALDPRDGHVLVSSHTGGFDTVAPGRILLQTTLSGRDCRLDIVTRSGRISSPRVGCGPTLGLATRAYVATASGELDAVDVRTGRAHRLGPVRLSGIPAPLTIAGENVVVRRSGDRLTAVDAASGRRLWSRGFSGGHPPEMSIAGDLVSVIVEPHGPNPFLGKDARDEGDELVVLDARTGKERGSLVVPAGIRGTVALGDGRVLAVDRDGVHRVIG